MHDRDSRDPPSFVPIRTDAPPLRRSARPAIQRGDAPKGATPVPVARAFEPAQRTRVAISDPRSALGWADDRHSDVLVAALLEEWTEVCLMASRSGWRLGIPTGDLVLHAWARDAPPLRADEPPAHAFGRWLSNEIGRAVRRDLTDRRSLEAREPVVREVLVTAARLLRGVAPDLELVSAPPPTARRKPGEWLVDEPLAARLGPGKALQSLAVVRPLLRAGERVLVEGELC